MLTGRRTPEELVRDMRGFGLDLFVGEDGVVHGRFRERGRKMTLEMRAVAEELQGMNDEVAALLRGEAVQSYSGIPVSEALALGGKIKAGEMELAGPVIYHRKTGLCDLTVKGCVDG